MMQLRRGLFACITGVLLVWSMSAEAWMAQQAPAPGAQGAQTAKPDATPQTPAPAQPQPTPEQQDLATLSQLVDAVSAGQQAAPAGVPIRWVDRHYIKSQGDRIYIPFTVAIDRSQLAEPSTALYIRIVSQSAGAPAPAAGAAPPAPAPGAARPTYAWDTINFVTVPSDGHLSRAIALPPGTYDAYIAIKDKGTATPGATPKLGLLRRELTVPSFAGPSLDASSVILAREVEQLQAPPPAEQQQDYPYTFGTLQISPSSDALFSKSGQVDVFFWIYNASHAGGKPDVQVDYQFHHRMPGGELKYFNKTTPQLLNAETLPSEFNLTAGHQLLSSLAVPLSSFPEGDYRLEITITDNPTKTVLTRNVDFSVSA